MESVNTKPENKTAASEEPKAKEQNDIAKKEEAKSNNDNSTRHQHNRICQPH